MIEVETKAINEKALLQKMSDSKYKIKSKKILTLRELAYKKVKAEFIENSFSNKEDPRQRYVEYLYLLHVTRKEHYYNIDKIGCDPQWPICSFDLTYKHKFVTHFVFRIKTPITQRIKENHFYKETAQKSIKAVFPKSPAKIRARSISNMLEEPDIMIERNAHYCTQDIADRLTASLRKDCLAEKALKIYDHPDLKKGYYEENESDYVNTHFMSRLSEYIPKQTLPNPRSKSLIAKLNKLKEAAPEFYSPQPNRMQSNIISIPQ